MLEVWGQVTTSTWPVARASLAVSQHRKGNGPAEGMCSKWSHFMVTRCFCENSLHKTSINTLESDAS